jgi:hypothetical protein
MQPTINFDGDVVHVQSPEGQQGSMKLEDLFGRTTTRQMDSCGVVLPNGVKLMYSNGPLTVWVHETPPRVMQLKWIAANSPAPFGPTAKYRMVQIALPYLVVLAAFDRGRLSDFNECFFRTAPIESENDELLYPGLLNCSRFEPPNGHPLSWICSQHLDRQFVHERDPNRRMRLGFKSLLHCLIETGFNQSSDEHEYSSWFTESCKVDPRVATIEKWEATSQHDPMFVLDVPWLKTGMSVKAVVERLFKNHRGSNHRIRSVLDIARLILNQSKLS